MAHYPADTFQEATEIAIEASNQLHSVINGDANAEVTVEDGSKIPSVRKAMVDSLYFKPPIAWAQGEYEDTYNQLREFVDGDVRTWWFAKGATVSTPVLMTTNPAIDVNWTLWSAVTLNAATYETQKRLAAEAGLNMVGSFLLGGTVTNVGDVVFYETDGKYYGWGGTLPKTVPAGSTPATTGGIRADAWIDSTDLMLRSEISEEISFIGSMMSNAVFDFNYQSLQDAITASINNTLFITKNHSLTDRLLISGDLVLNVLNESEIIFDNSINIDSLGLLESTGGGLTIVGNKLTLNASGNTGSGAIISCITKLPKLYNELHLINMPNGSALYCCSGGVGSQSSGIYGDGLAENIHTDNVANSVIVYGQEDWSSVNPLSDTNASFYIGDKSKLKATALAYYLNKLFYAEVGSCLCADSGGFYREYDADFSINGWTATGSTINQNSFTTTANGGVYLLIDDIVIGQDYFVIFGGKTTASGLEIRNGQSGTSPLITTVTNQVARFTAATKYIYLRQIGAGSTTIEDFAIFKASNTSSNIYQCGTAKIDGTRYIGTKRGPVIGIDCKNFDVINTKTLGATVTSMDIDTESLAGQTPLYPDAYGNVANNLAKYAGQRGLYITCRRLKVHDNQFFYAADCTDATIKSAIRVNTQNYTEDTSGVEIYDNTFFGNNGASIVSAYRGKVIIGDNVHDSTSDIPYTTDPSGDATDYSASISFTKNGSSKIKTLTTASNVVRNGDDISVTDASVSAIKLQSNIYGKSSGWQSKIVRANGNSAIITVSVTSGSINGSSSLSWPADVKSVSVVCYSDSNDYIVTLDRPV